MRKKLSLFVFILFFSTSIFSSNNLEETEIIVFKVFSKKNSSQHQEKLSFLDLPEFIHNGIFSKLDNFNLLHLRQVNKKIEKMVMSFPTVKTFNSQLKEAEISYYEIKRLKTPHQENQYSRLLDKNFIDLLHTLQIVADQGTLKAARIYFRGLRNTRKGNIDEVSYLEFLNKKAIYRDLLIFHYKEKLANNKNEQKKNELKYKMAKFMFFNNCDDSGNLRKKEGLFYIRELEAENFAKAFFLHYTISGSSNPYLLDKAKELGYKKF